MRSIWQRRVAKIGLGTFCLLVYGMVLAQTAPAPAAQAQPAPQATTSGSVNLAPGFQRRDAGSRLVVLPVNMELFSQSAGGVLEPKADWTAQAQLHLRTALTGKQSLLGEQVNPLKEADLDELAELMALHDAVASNIFMHHASAGAPLPTKDGKLNWSLGDAVQPLRERSGADYALLIWMRDSYASSERKAAMVVMAALGVGIMGGIQVGHASLVDLRDGRVVWFNKVARSSGDLREAESAKETVDLLLSHFPARQ